MDSFGAVPCLAGEVFGVESAGDSGALPGPRAASSSISSPARLRDGHVSVSFLLLAARTFA